MGGRALPVLALLIVAACAPAPPLEQPPAPPGARVWLFRAESVLQDDWHHVHMRGRTDYRLSVVDGELAIRARGRNSASGLFRYLDIDPRRCSALTWAWRVEALQADADLRVKAREDVAASLFLLFGDPGLLIDPKPVPTLRYVWTNAKAPPETVIDSPYLPGVVRSLVVRSGTEALGAWHQEERDLAADFEAAFGHPPEAPLQALALFTDNDQTRQPVEAYYAWASVACAD